MENVRLEELYNIAFGQKNFRPQKMPKIQSAGFDHAENGTFSKSLTAYSLQNFILNNFCFGRKSIWDDPEAVWIRPIKCEKRH